MNEQDLTPLSDDELAAESGTALPPKEVISLLDLNADLDLGLDVAAPIDLAVAANANVAAPIDAAVGANILSAGSTAQSLADQGVVLDQGISGHAAATAPQDSTIDQTGGTDGTTAPTDGTTAPTDGTTTPADGTSTSTTDPSTVASNPSSMLDGDVLNVDVNANLDANLAAPIAGAVAANANVAAPIDAAASANVGSIDSSATAIADQGAVISQHLDGVSADATADQQSDLTQ